MGVWDGRSAFAVREVASAFSLEQDLPNVLPLFLSDDIRAALRRLRLAERHLVLRHNLLPLSYPYTERSCVVASRHGAEAARAHGFHVVGSIALAELRQAIQLEWGKDLLGRAVLSLWQAAPYHSARLRLTDRQLAVVLGLGAVMIVTYAVFGASALAMVLGVVTSFFFLSLVALRIFCLVEAVEPDPAPPDFLSDAELPVYTVLVPLFRETSVLNQLLGGLCALNYPPSKLDIKLLLEAEDLPMHAALSRYDLPPHFDVIVVPAGSPQTKPRALNYGLAFARGRLLTIYDSEDVPDRQQLRVAATHFANSDPTVACLQARLAFYNARENWLTRQFAVEYASLFNVVLPGLASQALPLPLGGTSNHFRVAALNRVGSWDPFNVTEDADLGLRLSKAGYLTETLDSTTWEEANTQLPNWMKQRRRWLKGFLHTWLVHMRHPIRLFQQVGWDGFWVMQAMTFGVFVSALLHPFLMAHALWYFGSGAAGRELTAGWHALAVGIYFCVLAAGYGTALFSAKIGLRRIRLSLGWTTFASIPLYWLLATPAAWLALWDFIVRPHHWHKTDHGLSRIFDGGRRNGRF